MLPSNWPQWVIIPIGFVLAMATIGLGLILEPAVQSLAQHPEPTPTLPCLEYAAPLSGECTGCHTNATRIQELAARERDAERLFIETAHVRSVHGQLGCVTCHGGTPETDDISAAHDALVQDPSSRFERTCLLCHRDLRDPASEELLHKPHEAVLASPAVVNCSSCHGAVGHGFAGPGDETVCSMGACLDCHEERDLDAQSQDCDTCHVGPHDVAAALSCNDCHASVETWSDTRLSVHPVDLSGQHAEAGCFECHTWPDFRSLDYVCGDCHERSHEFGEDDCASCHDPKGWDESTMQGHTFSTNHGGADGECSSCHAGGETSTYCCSTCHLAATTVENHDAHGVADVFGKCLACHPEG